MAFDPSQFGATLVTPSTGFNPANFGATAVVEPTSETPPITTPTGQSTPAPQPGTNKVLNAANSTAGFLGIQKFGQGLATTGRVASGAVNQTGAQEVQMAKDQQVVINKLQQLRAQGVPRTD